MDSKTTWMHSKKKRINEMKRYYHLLPIQSLGHKVLEKIKNILRMYHCMFGLFLCSSINNRFGHCQGRDMGLSGNFGPTKPHYSSYVRTMNLFSASLAQSSVYRAHYLVIKGN